MGKIAKRLPPYLFLSPYFVLFGLFGLFPILHSFYLSFTKWNGFGEMSFIGFRNYSRLFQDPFFYKSLFNTMLMIAIAIPFQIATAVLLAVAIKQFFHRRAGNAFQLLNFLPYLTTPIAVGVIFQILFDHNIGSVNLFLTETGIADPVNWMDGAFTARMLIVLVVYWKYFGYIMLLVFAGLSAIPKDIYDASSIDGASWTATLLKITVPLLRPILIFITITCIISGFQMFDEPVILFNKPYGGPDRSVLTVVMHFYDTAFQRFELGYGASMAYGLFVIIGIFSIASYKLMNRGADQ